MQPSGLALIFDLIGIEPSGNYKVFTLCGFFVLGKIWEVV